MPLHLSSSLRCHRSTWSTGPAHARRQPRGHADSCRRWSPRRRGRPGRQRSSSAAPLGCSCNRRAGSQRRRVRWSQRAALPQSRRRATEARRCVSRARRCRWRSRGGEKSVECWGHRALRGRLGDGSISAACSCGARLTSIGSRPTPTCRYNGRVSTALSTQP